MSVSFNDDPAETGFQPNPTVDITVDVSPPNASPTSGETKSEDDQKPSDQTNLDYVLTIMDIPIPTQQVLIVNGINSIAILLNLDDSDLGFLQTNNEEVLMGHTKSIKMFKR